MIRTAQKKELIISVFNTYNTLKETEEQNKEKSQNINNNDILSRGIVHIKRTLEKYLEMILDQFV